MVDRSTDREVAGTSIGKKAFCKHISKAEAKDLEWRHKSLERQVSKAALNVAARETRSHTSTSSHQILAPSPSNQAWSPEGAGETSTGPVLLTPGEQGPAQNPFACQLDPSVPADPGSVSAVAASASVSPLTARPASDPFKDLPEDLQILIDQTIASHMATVFQGHHLGSVVSEQSAHIQGYPSASLTSSHSPDASRSSEVFVFEGKHHSDFSDDRGYSQTHPPLQGFVLQTGSSPYFIRHEPQQP